MGTLKTQSIALLMKWWWRLYNCANRLWKNEILIIHNLRRKPVSYIAQKSSNGLWSNIYKEINNLDSIGINYKDYFRLISGSSVNILFWKDIWCANITFESPFPTLCNLEERKCFLIHERIFANGFSWRWKQIPRNEDVLREIFQLYLAIGNMQVPSSNNFGFRFTINSNGRYADFREDTQTL